MYTHLEDYINNLFKAMGITEPKDLTIENVTKKLNLKVVYKHKVYKLDDEIILSPSTERQEWMDFVHELAHHLRHVGMQLVMHPLFIDLQEYQASHFSYHFCVPTFMLQRLKEVSVHVIMNLFNVEEDFAVRRLEMYQSKVFSGRFNLEIAKQYN